MFLTGFGVLFALAAASHAIAEQFPLGPVIGSKGNDKRILTPELSKYIETLRTDGKIPGLTLEITHSDGRVEHGAWGIKAEDGTNMTTDTLFILASTSKAFLATSVGLLMDDFANGRNVTSLPPNMKVFDWGSKVVDILPDDWQLMDEWATKKATIRDILSHVSGLPRHDFALPPDGSPRDAVRKLRELRPTYELREQWSYNNWMYITGSHMVTTYSGMPYVDFVKKRIFEPLGMSASTDSVGEAQQDDKLTQSWKGSGRRIPTPFSDAVRDLHAGPGGIISSVVDMTNWLKVWLDKGVDRETNATIIPKSVFEAVTAAHAVVDGQPKSPNLSVGGYGMGWFRESYNGHDFVSHTGGIPGFSTIVGFLPTDGVGVVILANADAKGGSLSTLINHIVDVSTGSEESGKIPPPHSTTSKKDKHQPTFQLNNRTRNTNNLTLNIGKYAGHYCGGGYGCVTLCTRDGRSSPQCRQVMNDFATFDDLTSEDTQHTLYAKFETAWTTHIRLRHVKDNEFGLAFTELFPQGYGKDQSPYETSEGSDPDAPVIFKVEEDELIGGSGAVAFGVMGTPQEQEGRKHILAHNVRDPLDLALVVMERQVAGEPRCASCACTIYDNQTGRLMRVEGGHHSCSAALMGV